MNNLFLFLFLLSFIALTMGIIKPKLVVTWGDRRTRKQVLKTYLVVSIAFLILFGLTVDQAYNSSESVLTQNEYEELEIASDDIKEITYVFKDEDNLESDENKNIDNKNNSSIINDTSGKMIVHFIDVGQGDATLIQTPGGKSILVDAGEGHMGGRVVSYIKSLGIDTVDLLIGTHPHADHIGGMEEVVNSFNIGTVSMPKVTHTSKTYENLLVSIKNKNLTVKTAMAGVSFDIDPMVELLLVAPNSTQYTILNDYSAALKVTYSNSTFLITGDAEINSEMEMIKNKYDINVDVLRTGHHGSATSSTSQFLNATSPKYAIISVGKGNRYNHPSREALTRLSNNDIVIFRTDEHGTIVFITDGQTYDINTKQLYQLTSPKEIPENGTTQSTLTQPVKEQISLASFENAKGKININIASFEELQEIIHIGPERAQDIINRRPFTSIDGLTAISGIGEGRLKEIIEEGKAYVQ